MIQIGRFSTLTVIKKVPFGVYLDGKEWGEILLPTKVVPDNTNIGDALAVFIYFDSEDQIIATTKKPLVQLGGFAYLKVVDVNRVGAFLDWGLDKDLLVPKSEQKKPMELHKSYIVYVKQDHQDRLIASSKLDYYLNQSPASFAAGEQVNLLIAEKTQLGQKVIINDSHWGLIYLTDLFKPIFYGQKTTGFIKTMRDDSKIDVTLRPIGQDRIQALSDAILNALHQAGGFLPLHDKSSAQDIKNAFNDSKSSFKRAIGLLYKQGDILIEHEGIRLNKK